MEVRKFALGKETERKGIGLSEYVLTLVSSPEDVGKGDGQMDSRVYSFLLTPRAIERVLLLGFGVCMDSFLFILTVLPLRILDSLRKRKLTSDVVRGLLVLGTVVFLLQLEASRIYHFVRGQAAIKLYVIYNVLEFSDRLFASLGADLFEVLFPPLPFTQHGNVVHSTCWRSPTAAYMPLVF